MDGSNVLTDTEAVTMLLLPVATVAVLTEVEDRMVGEVMEGEGEQEEVGEVEITGLSGAWKRKMCKR
jgi:hypothetical protein